MKKAILLGSYIAFIATFISCSQDSPPEDSAQYYRFNPTDKDMMLKYNYQEGQVITYQNQDSTTVHFKVLDNLDKKYGMYDGSFWGTYNALEYYYDSKIIRLEIMENNAAFAEEQVIYGFSKSEGRFKNMINFPCWNEFSAAFMDEMDRPQNINLQHYNSHNKMQVSINGHLFTNVVEINSASDEVLNIYYGGTLPKNISKLLFDYDFGIIQFSDIYGNTWKVVYPD